MKIKAFTLSEVLITLVIIGVIAAITIPSVVLSTQRRETITGLKKAYSVLNNWQTIAQVTYGHHSQWDSAIEIGIEQYYEKYIKPYFNIMKKCTSMGECGYNSNAPFKFSNGNSAGSGIFVADGTRVAFLTNDGMAYSFVCMGSGGTEWNAVRVDINGAKKPNQFGRDVFVFIRTDNSGVKPLGYSSTPEYVKANCSRNDTGDTCAARIIRNGWEFDEEYPF